MNDQRPYGVFSPGASRLKRKERESQLPPVHRQPPPPRMTVPASKTATGSKGIEITSPNKLVAGFMAYEFLTKGTLLGHKYDAAQSETAARGRFRPDTVLKTPVNGNESYEQITSLLMMKTDGGDHIPGDGFCETRVDDDVEFNRRF